MKKLSLIFLAGFFSVSAFAASGTPSDPIPMPKPVPTNHVPTSATQQQQQQQQEQTTTSTTTSEAVNAGNTQQIVFTSPGETSTKVEYSGTQTVKNVPSMAGPNLVSSNDTCMGSSSGAISAPGVGLSLGTTWTDRNCVRLKNARELWNMGMKGGSIALMCMDSENREALELTGFECPQTTRDRHNQVVTETQTRVQTSGPQTYTDPFIRRRLGLN